MDGFRTDSSIKRLMINDDPERMIEFDPTDVLFIERFYAMYREFEAKQKEYEQRANELDTADPESKITDGIQFLKDVCGFMHGKIDVLFGAGTSQKAFGDSMSLNAIGMFFEGVTPFIMKERSEKVQKYSNAETEKKNKHVMK